MDRGTKRWRLRGGWVAAVALVLAAPLPAQVSVELRQRGAEAATVQSVAALEKSRAALLEAREAVDLALSEVDFALAAVRAAAPREDAIADSSEGGVQRPEDLGEPAGNLLGRLNAKWAKLKDLLAASAADLQPVWEAFKLQAAETQYGEEDAGTIPALGDAGEDAQDVVPAAAAADEPAAVATPHNPQDPSDLWEPWNGEEDETSLEDQPPAGNMPGENDTAPAFNEAEENTSDPAADGAEMLGEEPTNESAVDTSHPDEDDANTEAQSGTYDPLDELESLFTPSEPSVESPLDPEEQGEASGRYDPYDDDYTVPFEEGSPPPAPAPAPAADTGDDSAVKPEPEPAASAGTSGVAPMVPETAFPQDD